MSVTHSVTDQYSVRVWQDQPVDMRPSKWYWEVIERDDAPKVVRTGTALDKEKAYWAARMVIWNIV